MSTESHNDILDPPTISMINKRNTNVANASGHNLNLDNRANANSRLGTPFSSRANSSSNLPGLLNGLPSISTKVHMKRPTIGERTESTESIKTPQKTSNKYTIQTSARDASGTPINTPVSATPVKASVSSNPSEFTTLDMGKKRLVDQFYSSSKKPYTASGTDVSQTFRNGSSISPSSDKVFRFSNYTVPSNDSLSSESISELVQTGSFTYPPVQNHSHVDDTLIDHLLNIDTLVSTALVEGNGSHGLAVVASSLSDSVVSHTKDLLATISRSSHVPKASTDLDTLSAYLNNVRQTTIDTLANLDLNKDLLKNKFRTDINSTVKKLDEVLVVVNTLEKKLSYIRDKVNSNKSILSDNLAKKLELLEKIDKRISESARTSRQRYLQLMSISAALLLAFGLLYMAYFTT